MDLIATTFTDPVLMRIFGAAALLFVWVAWAAPYINVGRPVLPAADNDNRPTVEVSNADAD